MAEVVEADDQVDTGNDGSLESAAAAFNEFLNPKQDTTPAEKAAPTESAPTDQPTGQAEAQTGDNTAQAGAPDNTASQAAPQPAKQHEVSPELTQRLQEADKAKTEAEAVINRFVQTSNSLIPQMQAAIMGEFADIKSEEDLDRVGATDPDRYNRFLLKSRELGRAQQARDSAVAIQKQTEDGKLRAWREEQDKELVKLLPDIADPVKGPVLAKNLAEFAKSKNISTNGKTAPEIALLHDAWQASIEKATQAKAQEEAKLKAKGAPQVQQPGTQRATNGKDEKFKTDFGRLQKSGRIDDAASVFANLLSG